MNYILFQGSRLFIIEPRSEALVTINLKSIKMTTFLTNLLMISIFFVADKHAG